MKKIGKSIKQNETFLKREDYQKNLVRILNSIRKETELGGGEKAIKKQHSKGK